MADVLLFVTIRQAEPRGDRSIPKSSFHLGYASVRPNPPWDAPMPRAMIWGIPILQTNPDSFVGLR